MDNPGVNILWLRYENLEQQSEISQLSQKVILSFSLVVTILGLWLMICKHEWIAHTAFTKNYLQAFHMSKLQHNFHYMHIFHVHNQHDLHIIFLNLMSSIWCGVANKQVTCLSFSHMTFHLLYSSPYTHISPLYSQHFHHNFHKSLRIIILIARNTCIIGKLTYNSNVE